MEKHMPIPPPDVIDIPPLRILMIAPNPFFVDRGFSVQVYEQARELIRLGHQVTICTYHCGRDLPGLDIRRTPNIPWYTADQIGASYHRLYINLLLFALSLRVCREIKPDVIHGHIHEGALIGEMVRWVTGVPVLFDLQGGLVEELRDKGFLKGDGLLVKTFRWLERRIDHGADLIVTQSAAMAEDLRVNFGVPPERVHLTMDGVNTEDFRPGLATPELRRELGLPSDKKIVVYLGLLTEYQGVDCLLQAIPLVIRQYPAVHFLIMGYPVEKYQRMAAAMGISDHITFTGRIDYARAAEYICLGDVAASPKLGKTEANGKLYNYMACGLPTVAFDAWVNREILGEYGVYASPIGDPAALANAIVQVLSDDELARRLGQGGRERVVKMYSWANVARRLVQFYGMAQANHKNRAHAR